MRWVKTVRFEQLSQRIILLLFLFSLSNYSLSAQDLPIGTAQIAKWKGNKQAALILQFDDSTPGQATLGLSACINRNIVGTWYVNPGTYIYNEYRDYWETIAPAGGQELANHTMNHTGANTFDEIVYEVGQASREIWRIRGHDDFTSLIAFNRGGGTSWNEDFLAQILEQYMNIDRLTYLGVRIEAFSVVPGSTVSEMFDIIPTILNEGIVGHINFHGIATENGTPPMDWGNSAVWIDEFEAFLDLLVGIQDELWIDGYTSICKYRRENDASTITTTHPNNDTYIVNLTTQLDTEIYDEQLSVLLRLPADWNNILVQNNSIEIPHSISNGILTFNILPNTGDISILRDDNELIPPTSVEASEIEICSAHSTVLSHIGGSGTTFGWYASACDGTLIGNGNNLNITPEETTTYFGRWERGNESTTCKSITISVNNNPEPPESVSASNETICNGASTTLSYSGGSGTTFAWYSGACGGELVGTGNNLTVAPTTTTSYFGRWENQCGYSNCQEITIDVNDVPNLLSSISGETHPCIHSELTYSVENNKDLEYEWSLPQGYIGTSNTNQIMVIIGSTKGNIKVTAINSCGYGISKQLLITPDTNLTEIIEQPHDINAKIGDDVSFNLSVKGENLLYQWKFEDNNIDGANGAVLDIRSTTEKDFGNYSVVIYGNCGHEQSETAILSLILSNEKDDLPEIKIFPNPNDGQFVIENVSVSSHFPIIITDIYGKTIHRQILTKGKNKIVLTGQSGIYFIHFKLNGQSIIKKLIIE